MCIAIKVGVWSTELHCVVKYAHGTRIDPSMYPIFNSLRLIHFQTKTTVVGIAPTKKPWDMGHALFATAPRHRKAPQSPHGRLATVPQHGGGFFWAEGCDAPRLHKSSSRIPRLLGYQWGECQAKKGLSSDFSLHGMLKKKTCNGQTDGWYIKIRYEITKIW